MTQRWPSLLAPILALALLPACWLEKVTGEEVPLDPDFYEAVEAAQGQPGVGGGSAVPFSDDSRPRLWVRGSITGGIEGQAVDLDVRVPDPTAPGGVAAKGKLLLEGPGAFELEVPVGLGPLELQAFQDKTGDGPSADDPFAEVKLEIGEDEVEGLIFELVEGARGGGGGGPVHTDAPLGAPGGDPNAGAPPGAPPEAPPGSPPPVPEGGPGGGGGTLFADVPGPRVQLRGALIWTGTETIDLDLFRPDDRSQGGRRPVGKLKLKPGPFSLAVPQDFGPLVIEAFIDLDANGPGPGDPRGCFPGGALSVGRNDVDGLNISLTVAADGKAESCGAPGPQGGQGPPPGR